MVFLIESIQGFPVSVLKASYLKQAIVDRAPWDSQPGSTERIEC